MIEDSFKLSSLMYEDAETPTKRRFAARVWMTAAIERTMKDGHDVRPGMALLQALENLDVVEVVENIDTAEEEVVSVSCAGPEQGDPAEGRTYRSIGKVDPILTLPEVDCRLVAGKQRGKRALPSETSSDGYAIAAVERLTELGMGIEHAISFVEQHCHMKGLKNKRKKMNSDRGYEEVATYRDKETLRLRSLSKEEVISDMQRFARTIP